MELNLERPRDYLFVNRANALTVVVGGQTFTASLILTRGKVIADWAVHSAASMTPADAEPILALQPDANDAPSLFTVAFTHAKRADYPPGRGFLVQGGHRTGVHIAMPEDR